MVIKKKLLTTIFPVITILLVLSLSLPSQDTVNAVVVFTDDFNDGNYNGWGTFGTYTNTTDSLLYPTTANFSAADNTLKATGPVGVQGRPQHNIAYVNSSVAYGNWTFDILVVEGPVAWFQVAFIADAPAPPQVVSAFPPPNATAIYTLDILTHALSGWNDRPTIWLTKYSHPTWTQLDEYAVGPSLSNWSTGWNHFEVLRNTTGHFQVYLNGTLRLEAQDDTITTSNYFSFIAESGQAIDNVIIDNGAPEPPPIPGFPAAALAIGLALGLGLIVIVRRRRS